MAINKEIMEDIIENILKEDTRDRLLIHYDGFIGRGINGVSSRSVWLAYEEIVTVNMIEQYDGDVTRTDLISYDLKEEYLIARYQDYRKGKYSKEFIRRGKEYSMIIPYSSISSMEIRHND